MEACNSSVLYFFCLRSIVLAFVVYEKFGFNNFNIFYHNSRSEVYQATDLTAKNVWVMKLVCYRHELS